MIRALLKRWGFVKLERYGLSLNDDGRVVSRRGQVLDDGLGGRVVGWEDKDLAVAELRSWDAEPIGGRRRGLTPPPPLPPARRGAAVSQPSPVVIPDGSRVQPSVSAGRPVDAMPGLLPARGDDVADGSRVQPVMLAPRAPEAATPAIVTAMPDEVADEAVVDEDDWEWTIALAKARAVVELVPSAAGASTATAGSRGVPTGPRTARGAAVTPDAAASSSTAVPSSASAARPPRSAAPRTQPLPTVATKEAKMDTRGAAKDATTAKEPTTSAEWPATAPLGAIDYDDSSRVVLPPAAPPPRTRTRPTTPNTVIPVPALPTMQGAPAATRIEPVVRSAPSAANLAVGDRTRPGIALPPAAGPVALPGGRRRMSGP